MSLLLVFLLSIVSPISVMEHDIHLSVTEINSEGNDIEIVTKIFFDDLQTSMGLVPGEELPDHYTSAEDVISTFVNKHLILTLNGVKLEMELSEIQPSLPAVWTTLTIKDVTLKTNDNLVITNTIMTDLFDDQKNLVKLKCAETKTDFSLDSYETKRTIKI